MSGKKDFWFCDSCYNINNHILLTKITAAQNEDALIYHRVLGQ